MSSTIAASSSQYLHQVVQNSNNTTLPLTGLVVELLAGHGLGAEAGCGLAGFVTGEGGDGSEGKGDRRKAAEDRRSWRHGPEC
jgi:hypothetical protein